MPQYPARPIGRVATAGLLAAYFVVAAWGAQALGGGNAPAPLIWPASGVALALVLLSGLRAWPWIFAAAVPAALLTSSGPVLALLGGALLNGAAAAIEAVLAAWLIWRMVGEAYLSRAGAFLQSMLIAAPIACVVSAVLLVLGHLASGWVTTHSWVGVIDTWHFVAVANWMGFLTLAPPVVLWMSHMRLALDLRELGELLAFGSIAAGVLLTPAPEQARYALVAVHLAIAMRAPLKWTAAAVALTSMAYLLLSTFTLSTLAAEEPHVFFLQEVVFAFTLNVATYVTALLHGEADERRARAEELARELSGAETRERQRIAQLLHDHLQQLLVAANMAIGRLRQGDQNAGERAERLIGDAIREARSLTLDLHPPLLDTLGFTAAFRWLGDEAREQHGLEVHVETDGSPDVEAPEVASFVLQATRELLFNTVKHSGADEAWLRMRRTSRWLEVEVEDRGTGCDPQSLEETTPGHFGLSSIRQRIELLGGQFDVSTRTGCHTRLRLPLPRSARHRLRWRRRLRRSKH